MRRKDREVTDFNQILNVLQACDCCRLGLWDNGSAYIVPMHFGYTEDSGTLTFYFHSAKEGRKIELMRENPSVGFEMDTNYQFQPGESACQYTAKFQSIIGTGTISFLEDFAQKQAALQKIMAHYTQKQDWTFDQAACNSVCVFQMEVVELSCKIHE